MSTFGLKNIPPGRSSDERDLRDLLSELNQIIPIFVTSSIYDRDIFDDSDENHFTETLIKYLENTNPGSRFSYMSQASLPNKRSIDIGVYLKANSEHYIFCIEAKFLPPRDYVTGNYAAIKRYKKNEHGLSNRNPSKAKILPESAIVGYSKSGTFESHFESINNLISKLSKAKSPDKFGLTWHLSEHLQRIKVDKADAFSSSHQRVDGSMIKLHHFWLLCH